MTVAVMEGWLGKEGVPNPWLVPSEEAYAGSHRGEFSGRLDPIASLDPIPIMHAMKPRHSNRVLDLADLSIKLANVIFSIVPPLAAPLYPLRGTN
jgi:hypothetical protein